MKSESISTNLGVCVVGAGKMGADHIERLTRRIDGAEVSVVVDADLSRAQKAIEAIHSAVALSNIGLALCAASIRDISAYEASSFPVNWGNS